MTTFDLILRNATLVDPQNGVEGRRDIGIAAGRVAAVEPSLAGSAAREEDL
jgi:predicted amidohydrolase